MQTFQGGRGAKREFWVLSGMLLFLVLVMIAALVKSPPETRLDVMAIYFFAVFILMLFLIIVRMIGVEAWAYYDIGEEGIRKTTWLGTHTLNWNTISDYEVVPQAKKPIYWLKGEDGCTLTVPPLLFGERASDFETLLVGYLQPATLQKYETLQQDGIVRYPQRRVTFYVQVGMGLLPCMYLFVLAEPSSPTRQHPFLFIIAMVVWAVWGFTTAYALYRQEIRLSQSAIELRAKGKRTHIPLSEITAIQQVQKGENFAIYRVQSPSAYIDMNPTMPDFSFILDYLARYVTPTPIGHNPTKRDRTGA